MKFQKWWLMLIAPAALVITGTILFMQDGLTRVVGFVVVIVGVIGLILYIGAHRRWSWVIRTMGELQ